MENKTLIQKAKVGDTKFYQGKQYYVAALNANGKPLWRQIKGEASTPQGDGDAPSAAKKSAPAPIAAKKEEGGGKPAAAKSVEYDAPKPKVKYANKKPADGIDVRVPETWKSKSKKGALSDQHRSTYRGIYGDKSKKSDADVIAMVNKTSANEYIRQIAYEEAMARGIDESKLDVSGTLQDFWDRVEFEHNLKNPQVEDESEEEFETYDTESLGDLDPEEFVNSMFPGGDTGWDNEDDSRIQKEFNKLQSLVDRQRYDAFRDYMKRKDPYYKNPERQIQTLNAKLYGFIKDKNGPIFVSAGGAGAGKTSSALQVLDYAKKVLFDPNQHKPSDGDYDAVIVENDIEDYKDLLKLLSDYNGKLIIFDDKDKALIGTQNQLVSTMKSIADSNPKMRVFKNTSTGKRDLFTGQLLFITNKTLDKLNDNEDHKAIMSRAQKDDIHFTIPETLEVLSGRYKTMGGRMKNADPQEEAKIRKDLYAFIKANKRELDPAKFTVRKYEEALKYIDGKLLTSKQTDDVAKKMFGESEDWRKYIVRDVLNKGEEAELEKAIFESDKEVVDSIGEESKKSIREMYRKEPRKTIELFGKEIVNLILNGESPDEETETEEEVAKAFEDSLGDMTIEEAEQILGL